MTPRLSTKAAMAARLEQLDHRARFNADLYRGVAAGLRASGFTSDHVAAATHADHGEWAIDPDGRRIWRRFL